MKRTLAILLFVVLMALAGCGNKGQTPTIAPEASATAEVTATIEAATPASTVETAVVVETAAASSPTASATALPTQTAAEPTASSTPLPPIDTPTPTMPPVANIPAFAGMSLLYHVEGGIAGLCQDLAIFQGGKALFGSCGGLANGELGEEQNAQLEAWLGLYMPFTLKLEDNPGGPDNMTTSLIFAGQGTQAASDAEQQEVVDWARAAYSKLAGTTMPPAAVSGEVQRTAMIAIPEADDVIISPVIVSGEGINNGEDLIIRVQDQQGNIIGQTLAPIDAQLGSQGSFTAEAAFTQPQQDEVGRIVVLAKEGESASALTSIEVTLAGSGGEEAAVVAPNLRWFDGPGFSLPYLSDSVVEHTAENQWKLAGRSVAIKPATEDWQWAGPAYSLNITLEDNPDGANSLDWTTAYLVGAWKAAKAENAPFTGPVNDQGQVVESEISQVRLGDKAAVQADWFGGDSVRRAAYLALPDKTISFIYSVYPIENYPFGPAADDVIGLTLAQVEAPTGEGTPYTTPLVQGVTTFTGPGFSILVPSNAVSEEVEENHWQITGPEVNVRQAEGEWAWDGPAYQLNLVLEDNPDKLSASDWAKQTLLDAWQQAKDAKIPFTGPVDDQGNLVADRAAEITVGGQPAFQADWHGAGGVYRIIYVQAADQILTVHFTFFPAESDPVAPLANAAHSLLVASIHAGP